MQGTLEEMDERFDELERLLQDPEVIQNGSLYSKYLREHGALSKIATKYRELKSVRQQIVDAKEMAEKESDPELREMAQEEIEDLDIQEKNLSEEMREILISDDEESHRNVIVEIRAGTGGDEACLFSLELMTMYMKYAEKKRWKVEILERQATELGGLKEVIFAIRGNDVYKHMKHESGGHRVQRIPSTESGGRIHTSAATVAVLPEADDDVEVNINPKDLKIEAIRASGPGGQNVNKTSSAIRITHIPTGVVVSCQDTPEQHKNKMKAMRILKTRLLQKKQQEQHQERNELRKEQHGSGDRNERIRTYNFPQNRVTDHRINLSIYNLQNILQGELDEFMEKRIENEREERLKKLGNIL